MYKYLNSYLTASSICVFLIIFCSASCYADDVFDIEAAISANKTLEIAKFLELEESEAKEFWSLYGEYEAQLREIHIEHFNLVQDFQLANAGHRISENIAINYLEKFFDLETRKLELRKKYKRKFEGVLTNKKVARFFQIDNKIEITLSHEISMRMGLIN